MEIDTCIIYPFILMVCLPVWTVRELAVVCQSPRKAVIHELVNEHGDSLRPLQQSCAEGAAGTPVTCPVNPGSQSSPTLMRFHSVCRGQARVA